jgi:hypothetical protein
VGLALNSDGLLPVAVHPGTLDEIKSVFVDAAPFKEQRQRVFAALSLYSELVWARFPRALLWVDGGFVTHKPWAAPKDVDVAVLIHEPYDPKDHPEDASLWTLLEVSASQPMLDSVERVQPMGGLVDGFYVPAHSAPTVDWWRAFWQRFKQPGLPDLLNAKGFVEVTRP